MIWAAANSNLALVKYWGKAGPQGNQAARGSISVTLDGLCTVAGVRFERGSRDDVVSWHPGGPAEPIRQFLDAVRERLGVCGRARVALVSNFPVAAGLASSASTFAALALATAGAAGRQPTVDELAGLARLGSGSACRSVLGGFVEWAPGTGADDVREIAPADHWPMAVLVAVTSERPKRVGSREGMSRTMNTSPYYTAWLEAAEVDLGPVREAIRDRDFARLGTAIERNCLRMHAAALGADPPLLYWEPATIAVIREVWRLREDGLAAWFSIDAGPQVKVLCAPAAADPVESAIGAVPGVLRVLRSRPGGAAALLAAPPDWARPIVGGAGIEGAAP